MVRYHGVVPYPDEELGSIVTRACRQTGLTLHRFSQWYLDAQPAEHLRGFGNLLLPVSRLSNLSPRELLWSHTLVPYGVAALSTPLSRRILSALIRGEDLESSPLLGKVGRHWCRDCVRQDLALYGESYWHRSHLLPGVTVCHLHGTALYHTARERLPHTAIHRAASYWLRAKLPGERDGQPLPMPISHRLQHQVAVWSAAALSRRRKLPALNLPLADLRDVFGPVLLRQAGCVSVSPDQVPLTTLRVLSAVGTAHLARGDGNKQLEIYF